MRGSGFKNTLKEFGEISSFGGFATKVKETRNPIRRTVWKLIIVGGVVWTSYIFYNTVMSYLKFNSFTTIEAEEQNIMKFPAVTICNNQPVHCGKLSAKMLKNCQEVMMIAGRSQEVVTIDPSFLFFFLLATSLSFEP